MLSKKWSNLVCLSFLGLLFLGASPIKAENELDQGLSQAPGFIIKKLDPETKTVTSYRLSHLDASLSPENLGKLSQTARKAKLDTFLKSVEIPANRISVEQVDESKASPNELDRETSTGACYYRWGYASGGYYGAAFFGYYGGARYNYQPCWGYGGYYGGGYYGYGYRASYYGGGYGGGYYGGGANVDPGYGVNPGYGGGNGYYPSSGYGYGYGYAGGSYNSPSYTLYGANGYGQQQGYGYGQ